MWNFFDLARQLGLPVFEDFNQAPESPGYYMLFGENGHFIYMGKATNLRGRIAQHFSIREPNIRIRQFAKYVYWHTTNSIAEAEQSEGEVFDRWVRATGEYPLANEIQPPQATVTPEEMLRIKIRNLLNR